MAGSGIRWGLSAEHRAGLGLGVCGDDNSALFGVQRMLMGYACGADPMDDEVSLGVSPYPEVGGLDAELAGSLAHLLQALIDWWKTCTQSATPVQWAERCRAMLADLFKPRDDNDRNALAARPIGPRPAAQPRQNPLHRKPAPSRSAPGRAPPAHCGRCRHAA